MINDTTNLPATPKRDITFPIQVYGVAVLAIILAAYPLSSASEDVIRASVAGLVLSVVNILLGYAAMEYSFHRSYTTFLKYVLGGMGVRMFVVFGTMVLLITVFHYHVIALTVSLLGTYIVYLVLEVIYIQKRLERKNRN
jgi:hypothetical protein